MTSSYYTLDVMKDIYIVLILQIIANKYITNIKTNLLLVILKKYNTKLLLQAMKQILL